MSACRECGEVNAAYSRFCHACGAPLPGEVGGAREARKTATIVFADLVEWTKLVERLDAESLRRMMTRYFDAMRSVVERHGGTVEKFIGDALMAAFGVPVAHEDDALRATRAAAAMRATVTSLNEELEDTFGVTIRARIGVATGEVVTGDPAGRESFVTGLPVNVASRLEEAARPGEILIDERSFQLVRHSVTVDRPRRLAITGKAKSVSVFPLVAVSSERVRPVRLLDSPFVGRRGELELLSEAFARTVAERECSLVTVLGPAGLGKSRLVEELIAPLLGDATIVRGRCLPYGEGITFWPLREMIEETAGLSGDEPASEARERIRSLLEPTAAGDVSADLIAQLIGLGEAFELGAVPLGPVQHLFESLGRGRPVVAVFDDLQWAEPILLDLVEELARRLRAVPVLLLCIARPDLLESRPAWARGIENAATIALQPLSGEECGRMIANLLGGAALADEPRARIAEASQGNPLFLGEVVAMLIEQGALRRRDGIWIAGDLSSISVPPTIHALLASRLDRLDEAERALLRRASVEGEVFHRGALLRLSPEEERPGVAAALNMLAEKQLIEPERASIPEGDAFRFHHLLLRDVAYDSLPKAERAVLHECFATWLQEQLRERAAEFEEFLGYHLEAAYRYESELGAAGERGRSLAERAAERLAAAGLRARARGDMPAAANLLTRALDLLPPEDAARDELLPALQEALLESGALRATRLSWSSIRCFWRRLLGHRWALIERRNAFVLRCSRCGRETGWRISTVPEGGHPMTQYYGIGGGGE